MKTFCKCPDVPSNCGDNKASTSWNVLVPDWLHEYIHTFYKTGINTTYTAVAWVIDISSAARYELTGWVYDRKMSTLSFIVNVLIIFKFYCGWWLTVFCFLKGKNFFLRFNCTKQMAVLIPEQKRPAVFTRQQWNIKHCITVKDTNRSCQSFTLHKTACELHAIM